MVWDPVSGTLLKTVDMQSFFISPGLVSSDWTLIQTYYYISKINFVQLFTTSDQLPGGSRDPNYFTKINSSSYNFNSNFICAGADPSQNAWHVSVITQKFSTKTMGVYLDGVYLGANSSPLANNAAGLYPGNAQHMNFFQNGNQSTLCRVGTIMLVPRVISQAEVTAVTNSCLDHWTVKTF